MITKERLEELIEQGATIYEAKYNDVVPVSLTNEINSISWRYGVIAFKPMRKHKWLNHKYFKNLFETEEEAREHLEFGNITRTERLELPSWASIEKDFDKFTNGSYVLAERDEFSLELKISKPLISQIIIYTKDDNYNWNLSRENYNKARRLCVKMFKGEKQ